MGTIGQSRWRKFGRSWDKFVAAGYGRSGTLVDVGGVVYLVGDINQSRGRCDDCTAFRGGAIVDRYMVVLSKDYLSKLIASSGESKSVST